MTHQGLEEAEKVVGRRVLGEAAAVLRTKLERAENPIVLRMDTAEAIDDALAVLLSPIRRRED